MTVDGKNLETYAIIKLSKRNPESDEIFKPLVAAGYEIIKRLDPEGNIIDHIVAKEKPPE
jgi:hypothetical protein